jgi:tetratricopeptide (TPR) repeat protein
MIEADRVLRPLEEAAPAIDKLETYESPAVLNEALRATWHAVERTLRMLLRSDAGAPDSVRMAALSSGDMTLDAVVAELRRRDRVSIQLAGKLHELGQTVRRTEAGGAKASDADLAQDIIAILRSEVHELADRPVRASAHAAVVSEALGDEVRSVPPARLRWARPWMERWAKRPYVLAAAAGGILIIAILAVFLSRGSSDMEEGVAAFSRQQYGVAEQRFRAELSRNGDNVTARLYLARILRRQARYQEAAELLRGAARTAPRDPAVRRELGRLFLDLNQPKLAADQFQQAVELDPEDTETWVFLVAALRRAGDPSADDWLQRAPAAAQARIQTGPR